MKFIFFKISIYKKTERWLRNVLSLDVGVTIYLRKRVPNKIEKSHVKVFRMPRKADDLQHWKKSIPYKNLKFSKDSVICIKHWPAEFVTVLGRGNKEHPTEHPSVWPGVPSSCVPTLTPAKTN